MLKTIANKMNKEYTTGNRRLARLRDLIGWIIAKKSDGVFMKIKNS
jgi:hypothetical protein